METGDEKKKRKEKRARESISTSDSGELGDYHVLLDHIKELLDRDAANQIKLTNMQSQLDQASEEIASLRTEVKSLRKSLEFTQNEQDEIKERVNTCEDDQVRQENELVRQNIYSRLWNLIFYGIKEKKDENCADLVKHAMASALKINQDKIRSTMYCGVHRLGKWKPNSTKPRPVIARFTCRADRDFVWLQRYNLKSTNLSLAEDLPSVVRDVRKNILVPAMRRAKETEGTKASIIGDRLCVNGRKYSYDKIPRRWQTQQATLQEENNSEPELT